VYPTESLIGFSLLLFGPASRAGSPPHSQQETMTHPTAFPRVEFQPLGPESRDSTCPENRLLSMLGFRDQCLGSPIFDVSSPAASGRGGGGRFKLLPGVDLGFSLPAGFSCSCHHHLRWYLPRQVTKRVSLFHPHFRLFSAFNKQKDPQFRSARRSANNPLAAKRVAWEVWLS